MPRPLSVALVAALGLLAGSVSASTTPTTCESRTFEGARFTVCPYIPQTQEIRLVLTGPDGKTLGSLRRLAGALGPDAARVRFAMNAGMFQSGGTPVGLYVEQGQTRKSLDTADGEGNFYLKPNGVFSVEADGSAHVETTGAYQARTTIPVLATQSGPMLLIDGVLHPKFQPDGPSRLIRNGVGLTASGGANFVISDTPVSFGLFARFFRDGLNSKDALYLDGTVSSLWAPSVARQDRNGNLGPFVVVLDRAS